MAKFSTNVLSYYQGLEFDGVDDYVELGNPPELHFNNGTTDLPFSISAKIKGSGCIISKASSIGAMEWTLQKGAVGTSNILLALYTVDGQTQINSQIENQDVNGDRFIHILSTYDGSHSPEGISIYVNGNLGTVVSTRDTSYSGMIHSTNPVRIGLFLPSTQWESRFNGTIEDIAMWNRELTPTEALDIYKGVIPSSGLVAHWPMNEGVGDVIYDHSPNQIDGIIHGATWTNKVGFKN